MKKIFYLITGIVISLFISGCSLTNKSNTINTTLYPITYITSYLYDTNENINSIYPSDTNTSTYKLSKKQIKEYSDANIFIYCGLSHEKQYAKDLINENHKLNIIDASENMKVEFDIKEIWLSPNNFLMLAKNIKNHLIELSTSQDTIKLINEKYAVIEQEISLLDADLRSIVTDLDKDKSPTLITTTKDFKFLEDYGFEIISLDEQNLSDATINSLKASFKAKKYSKILAFEGYKNSELVESLVNDYEAKIVNIKPLYTLSEDDKSKNENFISLMQENINNIRSVVE